MHADSLTRASLLARLKDGPRSQDWEHFYQKYWAVIVSFARRNGLDEHGAYDVLQETMMLLIRKMPEFVYDPERGRFRTWLLTIVRNQTRVAIRRSGRDRLVSLDQPSSPDAPSLDNRLAADPGSPHDSESVAWQQSLIEEALRRLQSDPQIKSDTFAVFRAYVIEGQPAGEVAARYGVKENAVYQIKNRLLKRLREEVAELDLDAVDGVAGFTPAAS